MATFDERAAVVSDATTGDKANVTPAGALQVDGSAVTQPISNANLDAPLSTLATEATLLTVAGDTANLDVALSTRASETTVASILAQLDVALSTRASEVTLAAILTGLAAALDVPLSTRASQATVASILAQLDVALSTRASEATLLTRVADATITARLNTLGQKAMAASAPVVIASDQSAVPISAASLPLPTGAATEATLLTRAAAAQLPAALVGGRLDTNLGAWLGSTAPTVGQKAMAASLPVTLASDQPAIPVSATPSSSTGSTVTQVAGSLVAVTLQAANAARKGLTLYNDGTQPWYVKLGAGATLTSFTVKILRDGYYEVPFGWTGIVTGIQAVASNFLYVDELT